MTRVVDWFRALRRRWQIAIGIGALLLVIAAIPTSPEEESSGEPTTAVAATAGATATATTTPLPTATEASAAPPPPDAPATLEPSALGESATVTNIVDGDTVDVVSGTGIEERIRVIGIDSPERGECGFDHAADALARLVADQAVTLVAGARDDRDRYGRLLRYLDIGTVDAGLELIRAGHAIARYDSRDGYGRHTREDVYVAADAASLSVCGTPTPAATSALPVSPSSAVSVRVFRNCAELNAVYPGGVARVGMNGNTVSGTLRPFGITPHFDDALYQANIARDGDKDGIACEK